MARTGDDWSCPLCTLLNTAEDNRCAACDNERPLGDLRHQPQTLEPSATSSKVQHVVRPIKGIFFSSLPSAFSDSRQEPRLAVNRRCGYEQRNVLVDREKSVGTGTTALNAGFTTTKGDIEQVEKISDIMHKTTSSMKPTVVTENEMERQEEEEEEEEEEEPCFNLLGSGAVVFNVPATANATEDLCIANEANARDASEEADEDDDVVVVSSPSRYAGFMPASEMHVKEPAIDKELASAGLDLSDPEDEEKEAPKQLRQRKAKNDVWEDKWVCQKCTNLNEQAMMECLSCSCKRYVDTPHESSGMGTGSYLRWACHICTSLNPPDVTNCLICMSARESRTEGTNNSSAETWACSLCTTINDSRSTRCDVCDRLREEVVRNPAGKGRECLVCTNINSSTSTRCEICDTCLPIETPDDRFYESSSNLPACKASYADDQDNLENPYANLSQYDDDARNEAAYNVIEEVSDHEPPMSLASPHSLKVRPDLKEFEHLVCMEELHRDYGCRINYSKMFAGQRSGKSYADRLATRQEQSRQRKRDAARREAGQKSPLTSRGSKKAVRGSKKKTAAASKRRASTSNEKAPKAKRARKVGVSTRRASSATTNYSVVNHYDDSGATLGDDLSTMAWEGIGSAGYR